MLRKGIKYFVSSDYRFLINAGMGFYSKMPDEKYLKKKYRAILGKPLNLDNPKTFNEKLQWLKLYDRKPIYTTMVDKYEAKKYVAARIGEEYIIPTIGVWNDSDEIEFDSLPQRFVLKCTHNSGLGMCICKDKSKLDVEKVRREVKKGLKQDYYLPGREWPYKDVKHRVLAEKYMEDDSGSELRDYKVLCFGGEPKLIQFHAGRFTGNHTQDYYDTNWERLPMTQGSPLSENPLEKPVFLEEMLDLSRKLSEGIPQVRVDWYYVKGQLYFGELTFFDASGFDEFEPEEWNETIGGWISLPKKGE